MTINMRMETYWNIISKYTDPDTGKETESVVAFSLSESYANLISLLLNESDDEPNRVHVYRKIETK